MDQKHPSQVAFLIMNPVCMSPRLHLSIINSSRITARGNIVLHEGKFSGTWFMIQQNTKTLLCESSTYLRFWIGFHEQPSYVSPYIRSSCAIPSSGSSRPLLSYVSPLLVPFSASSFLRSPGWLPARVSSLLVQSPPSSLAILLSTITTHRASCSCGFPTSSLPLIGLDDGMCKYLSGYVVCVQNTKCGDHEFLWRSC